MRIFWFLAGSGVNYLLIKTPFDWLKKHTELVGWQVSALSICTAASVFFLWNYFVNFRTGFRKREALPRYLAAVCIMSLLGSLTLSLLKLHDAHFHLPIFGRALDLDIISTQAILAGIKFPLYHFWAFPLPKSPPGERNTAVLESPSSSTADLL